MDSALNNFLEIGAVVLALLIVLGFLNLYLTIPKKLKGFLSFLIVIAATVWLLNDLGWLNNIIALISKWLKALK